MYQTIVECAAAPDKAAKQITTRLRATKKISQTPAGHHQLINSGTTTSFGEARQADHYGGDVVAVVPLHLPPLGCGSLDKVLRRLLIASGGETARTVIRHIPEFPWVSPPIGFN